MDDVNEVLESIQATNDNEDENVHTVVESCTHSPAPTGNDVTFYGFEHIYNKLLEVEDQLLCRYVQVQARNYNYSELRNSFELFQQKLRQVIFDAKRKREQIYIS